jgi:transcriptional regulator with XRE-family HTH domain
MVQRAATLDREYIVVPASMSTSPPSLSGLPEKKHSAERMRTSGQFLRSLRETLGFRLIDVEQAAAGIAKELEDQSYTLPSSTLADFENKNTLPTVHRFLSIAAIYRVDYLELLRAFGVDSHRIAELHVPAPKQTARILNFPQKNTLQVPILDPGFDLKRSIDLVRMVQQWGTIPLSMIESLRAPNFIYGYVGTEDRTMYPLILPGSFVQVDAMDNKVTSSRWSSEYERPIYMIETRSFTVCSWCSILDDKSLLVESHPLSGVPPRRLSLDTDADVLGRVVGVAMRLSGI